MSLLRDYKEKATEVAFKFGTLVHDFREVMDSTELSQAEKWSLIFIHEEEVAALLDQIHRGPGYQRKAATKNIPGESISARYGSRYARHADASSFPAITPSQEITEYVTAMESVVASLPEWATRRYPTLFPRKES